MEAIVQESNWGYWDTLSGRRVIDGEPMRVKWPNGQITEEVCHVDKRPFEYSDHGHRHNGPDDHAYVDHEVNGAKVRVWLRQPGILCERLPTGGNAG